MKKFLSLLLAGSMLLPTFAFAASTTGTGMMGMYHRKYGTATGTSATMMSVNASVTTGTVTGVTSPTLTMTSGSNTYTVDGTNAKIYRKYGAAITVSDINVGDSLSVNGTVSGTTITAKAIRDLSLQQKNATFSGTVSSLTGSGFVMASKQRGNQTVTADSTTVFKESGQSGVSLTNVMAGQNITVSGVWDSTNSTVAASTVTIVVKTGSWRVVYVSASGPSLSVTAANATSTAYTVDATNAKLIRRYGAAMQLTDMQAGDNLTVTGTLNGSMITAKTIRDNSLQAHNGTFVGTVSALAGDGVTFTLQSKARGGQTINTGTSTMFRIGTVAGSYSGLAVGETATISGVWDRTNSNVTANRVTVQVKSTSMTGTLTAINGTALTVTNSSSTPFSVDASKARVIFEHGHSGSLTNFQVNDQVKVWGKMVSGSTSITATIVQDLSRTYNATSTSAQ